MSSWFPQVCLVKKLLFNRQKISAGACEVSENDVNWWITPNVSRGSPNLSKSLQIKQNSNLIFHPLLVVKLDILFVLPSGTVGLPNRGRVVRQVGVAIVAVVLRHLGQVKQKSSSENDF